MSCSLCCVLRIVSCLVNYSPSTLLLDSCGFVGSGSYDLRLIKVLSGLFFWLVMFVVNCCVGFVHFFVCCGFSLFNCLISAFGDFPPRLYYRRVGWCSFCPKQYCQDCGQRGHHRALV